MESSANNRHYSDRREKSSTGYTTDPLLLRHRSKKSVHEGPRRLLQLTQRLRAAGLAQKCVHVPVRRASDDEVLTTHTPAHLSLLKSLETRQYPSSQPFTYLDEYQDTYACAESTNVALSSAGAAIDLGCKIARGELKNGLAAIRPPGHHCGREGPQGFCLVNNVAIAANVIRKKCPNVKRILIVDWDVHHGNGTEEIFLNDPDVLFYSMHRREVGFFPESGDSDLIGGPTPEHPLTESLFQTQKAKLLSEKTGVKTQENIENNSNEASTSMIHGGAGAGTTTGGADASGSLLRLTGATPSHHLPISASARAPPADDAMDDGSDHSANSNNIVPGVLIPSKPSIDGPIPSTVGDDQEVGVGVHHTAQESSGDASAGASTASLGAATTTTTARGNTAEDSGFLPLPSSGIKSPSKIASSAISSFASASDLSLPLGDLPSAPSLTQHGSLSHHARSSIGHLSMIRRGISNEDQDGALDDIDIEDDIEDVIEDVIADEEDEPEDEDVEEDSELLGPDADLASETGSNATMKDDEDSSSQMTTKAELETATVDSIDTTYTGMSSPSSSRSTDESKPEHKVSPHTEATAGTSSPTADASSVMKDEEPLVKAEDTSGALLPPLQQHQSFGVTPPPAPPIPTPAPLMTYKKVSDHSSSSSSSNGESNIIGGHPVSRPDIADPVARAIAEQGNPASRGRTINVPLPTPLGDYDYINVAKTTLLPFALEFEPDLIIVSAGFDPSPNDPLGGEYVTPAGFYAFTRLLMSIHPSVLVCLEGGYHPNDVADCGEACMRALLGLPFSDDMTEQDFQRIEQMISYTQQEYSYLSESNPQIHDWFHKPTTLSNITMPVDFSVTFQILFPQHILDPQFDDEGNLTNRDTTYLLEQLTEGDGLRRSKRLTEDGQDIVNQYETDANTRMNAVLTLIEACIDTLLCHRPYWNCLSPAGLAGIIRTLSVCYANCLIDPSALYYRPPEPSPNDGTLHSNPYSTRSRRDRDRNVESNQQYSDAKKQRTEEKRRRREDRNRRARQQQANDDANSYSAQPSGGKHHRGHGAHGHPSGAYPDHMAPDVETDEDDAQAALAQERMQLELQGPVINIDGLTRTCLTLLTNQSIPMTTQILANGLNGVETNLEPLAQSIIPDQSKVQDYHPYLLAKAFDIILDPWSHHMTPYATYNYRNGPKKGELITTDELEASQNIDFMAQQHHPDPSSDLYGLLLTEPVKGVNPHQLREHDRTIIARLLYDAKRERSSNVLTHQGQLVSEIIRQFNTTFDHVNPFLPVNSECPVLASDASALSGTELDGQIQTSANRVRDEALSVLSQTQLNLLMRQLHVLHHRDLYIKVARQGVFKALEEFENYMTQEERHAAFHHSRSEEGMSAALKHRIIEDYTQSSSVYPHDSTLTAYDRDLHNDLTMLKKREAIDRAIFTQQTDNLVDYLSHAPTIVPPTEAREFIRRQLTAAAAAGPSSRGTAGQPTPHLSKTDTHIVSASSFCSLPIKRQRVNEPATAQGGGPSGTVIKPDVFQLQSHEQQAHSLLGQMLPIKQDGAQQPGTSQQNKTDSKTDSALATSAMAPTPAQRFYPPSVGYDVEMDNLLADVAVKQDPSFEPAVQYLRNMYKISPVGNSQYDHRRNPSLALPGSADYPLKSLSGPTPPGVYSDPITLEKIHPGNTNHILFKATQLQNSLLYGHSFLRRPGVDHLSLSAGKDKDAVFSSSDLDRANTEINNFWLTYNSLHVDRPSMSDFLDSMKRGDVPSSWVHAIERIQTGDHLDDGKHMIDSVTSLEKQYQQQQQQQQSDEQQQQPDKQQQGETSPSQPDDKADTSSMSDEPQDHHEQQKPQEQEEQQKPQESHEQQQTSVVSPSNEEQQKPSIGESQQAEQPKASDEQQQQQTSASQDSEPQQVETTTKTEVEVDKTESETASEKGVKPSDDDTPNLQQQSQTTTDEKEEPQDASQILIDLQQRQNLRNLLAIHKLDMAADQQRLNYQSFQKNIQHLETLFPLESSNGSGGRNGQPAAPKVPHPTLFSTVPPQALLDSVNQSLGFITRPSQ